MSHVSSECWGEPEERQYTTFMGGSVCMVELWSVTASLKQKKQFWEVQLMSQELASINCCMGEGCSQKAM